MIQSGKNGTFLEIFWKSQNWFQTVPKGQNIPLYDFKELKECSSADMTQSEKHRIFYGILLNFLEGSITTFYSSFNVPNGPSIILCQLFNWFLAAHLFSLHEKGLWQ